MEHIIVTDLGNGFFRLKAERGWRLFAINLNRCVSSATVKEENLNNFRAIQ